MEPVTSLLLLGACMVAAIGTAGVWLALKRPARAVQRRRRDKALAAAQTPAEPLTPPAGTQTRAADLDAHSTARRARPARGRARGEGKSSSQMGALSPTELQALLDDPLTTSPMAWQPTLPLGDPETMGSKSIGKSPRRQHPGAGADADHEHITV
jgi:hypothetical protein